MDPVVQRRIAQAGKEVDPGWYRVHRNLSIHVTRGALALGLAANHASLAMMVCGLAGAAMLVPASPALHVLGFAILYAAFLLDKVDGELARLLGTQNARGIFLDRMHHRLIEPCLFLAVAVHEYLRTGSVLPLVAGFVTVVLANAIEENQHLAAYIVYKRVREGAPLPDGDAPRRSPGWTRAAALLRPLKGFRMFIVALPLFAVAYALEWLTGRPVPTFVLAASSVGLAFYLGFQCLYYLREQLDAETHAIASDLRSSMGAHSVRAIAAILVIAGSGGSAPAQAAGTYYVDGANPACSNGGPGTIGTPYCTIGAALAAQSGPNTTIRVAPGLYKEQVTIPGSGAAENPLVLQGDGTFANPVLIDGSEEFDNPALWAPATGTTWLASSVTWNALMVLVDGNRLVPWPGAPDSIPDGGFRAVPGTGLYVNLGVVGSAGNPGTHLTVVGRLTHGVFINNRSWVTIRGLRIRQTNDRGIQVTNSNNIVLEDNMIERVQRFGIQAQGSTDVLIQRNRVTASGDHGISLTAGTRASTVESNESDHNARPGVRAANGINLFGAPKNVVRHNRFHHNQDSGMHVQAASDSTLSYQNLSWENGDHGFDHLAVSGSIHLADVAYGNTLDGFSFEGNAQNQRMYDCISVANGGYNLYVDSTSAMSHMSNDNILWNSAGNEPVKFNKIEYATVSAYSFATGHDTRTIQADPLFLAPEVGDFHLSAGSPAIDAANTAMAEWPGTDAEGFTPLDQPLVANTGIGPVAFADRGAYEYGSGGIVDVPPDPAPIADLEGVSPNPLAGAGRLSFRTSRAGPLAVDLFDARGRLIRQLLRKEAAPAGLVVAPIDALDTRGQLLPAGIYLYRVRSADGERGGKFVIVR